MIDETHQLNSYSPGVGSLVREAMRKKWFGKQPDRAMDKRVALRCEKTARNFRSIVSFAAGLYLIKFVHTA